jgi:hypothetical protein
MFFKENPGIEFTSREKMITSLKGAITEKQIDFNIKYLEGKRLVELKSFSRPKSSWDLAKITAEGIKAIESSEPLD